MKLVPAEEQLQIQQRDASNVLEASKLARRSGSHFIHVLDAGILQCIEEQRTEAFRFEENALRS